MSEVWTFTLFMFTMGVWGVVRLAHHDPPLRSWRGVLAVAMAVFCLATAGLALWTILTR